LWVRRRGLEGRAGLKTRLYNGNNGAEKAAGLKPHTYNGREKGKQTAGLATVAWGMLA
jgi:hypothetical protein